MIINLKVLETDKSLTVDLILALVKTESDKLGMPFKYTKDTMEDKLKLLELNLLETTLYGMQATAYGKELLREVVNLDGTKITRQVGITREQFDEFWNAFPATDKHGPWRRTRSLRSNKEGSFTKLDKIVKSGVKFKDIMDALKWEVKKRKADSTTRNDLTFMKATFTWLNQKEYEIILEEMALSDQDSSDDEWGTTMI